VNPDFYGWGEDEQLRYRMTMSDRDRFLLERHLLKDLFGIECDSEEV